jgi:protein SCO1
MKNPLCLSMVVVMISLTIAGCQHEADKSKDKVYDIQGKVLAIDAAKKEVSLDHEAISGFMKAMKMEFTVEDAKLLEGLKPGDQVKGRLKVKSPGDYILTELKKT